MGKVVKAEIGKDNENQKEVETIEVKPENDNAQPAEGQEIQVKLNLNDLPIQAKKKKGFFDFIWRDRGVIGKTVTVGVSTGVLVGAVIGVKALVALLFGPEVAEMIDPSAVIPTEE